MIEHKNNKKPISTPRFAVAFPSCMKRRKEKSKPSCQLVPIPSLPAQNVDLVSSLHGKEKGREKEMMNQRVANRNGKRKKEENRPYQEEN
jgi:hypothetical protein